MRHCAQETKELPCYCHQCDEERRVPTKGQVGCKVAKTNDHAPGEWVSLVDAYHNCQPRCWLCEPCRTGICCLDLPCTWNKHGKACPHPRTASFTAYCRWHYIQKRVASKISWPILCQELTVNKHRCDGNDPAKWRIWAGLAYEARRLNEAFVCPDCMHKLYNADTTIPVKQEMKVKEKAAPRSSALVEYYFSDQRKADEEEMEKAQQIKQKEKANDVQKEMLAGILAYEQKQKQKQEPSPNSIAYQEELHQLEAARQRQRKKKKTKEELEEEQKKQEENYRLDEEIFIHRDNAEQNKNKQEQEEANARPFKRLRKNNDKKKNKATEAKTKCDDVTPAPSNKRLKKNKDKDTLFDPLSMDQLLMTINEIESEDGAKLREDGKCADNNKEKYLPYLPLFETAESTIPGAGVGVVAKENVPAGTQVGIYVGQVKSKADFINNGAGPYAIYIGNVQVLDAAGTSSSESLAHLCNTAFGTAQKNNARL